MDEPLPEKLSIRAAAAWLAGMRPVRPQEERINGTWRLERWEDETPVDYRTRSEKYAIFLRLVGEDVAKGVIHAEKEYEVIAQRGGFMLRPGGFLVRPEGRRELKEIWISTESLRKWAESKGYAPGESKRPADKPLGERERDTLLRIIGAMLNLMTSNTPGGQRPAFDSQAAIVEAMLARYEGTPGMAQRTINEKFAAAQRSITSI